MRYVRTIAKNGHSWHVTLPRRELIKLKLTPGVVCIADIDESGIHITRLREVTEAPLSDTASPHAKHK